MRSGSGLAAAATAVLVFWAGAADAALPPQAWDLWTGRAQRIVNAAEQGTPFASACDGVRRDMIRYPMPQWAQGMMQLCDALRGAQNGRLICRAVDESYNCTEEEVGITRGDRKHICMSANAALRALNGAKPVEDAPAAYPLALRLSALGRSVKGFYHCL